MVAYFPPATVAVPAILRAVGVTAEIGTRMSVDMLKRLPFVLVQRTSGGAIHPRFLDSATVDIQTWVGDTPGMADGLGKCAELAEQVRAGLWTAQRQQVVAGGASISAITEQAGPAELPADEMTPNGVYRYQASYSLALRPVIERN